MVKLVVPASNSVVLNDRSGVSGHGGGYALVAGDDSCCPPVTDPLTLGTVLAAVAAITVGLRQVVITRITGRKKRETGFGDKFFTLVEHGK